MNIIFDSREKSLYLKSLDMKVENINISSRLLDIGDIIIQYEDEIKIIIERKTVNDLLASIKDNRYKEQSLRLTADPLENHNIIYLIEGNIPNDKEKRMIYSSIFSLNYYKGFSVFKSKNIDESCYIIFNIAQKILTESKKTPIRTPYYCKDKSDTNSTDYVECIKKKKSDNITTENYGEIILCQIPKISPVVAKALITEYKTVFNILSKLKENKNCLADFKVNNRRISKNAIENIKLFLYSL